MQSNKVQNRLSSFSNRNNYDYSAAPAKNSYFGTYLKSPSNFGMEVNNTLGLFGKPNIKVHHRNKFLTNR
jgi:hypothetical protein